MTTLPDQRPESMGGTIVHNLPFPRVLNEETLALLKQMSPIQIEQLYSIMYLHSYGQDSPFFAGLTNGVFLGSRDPQTGYTYANPRGHDMYTGAETDWIDITDRPARVHAFTVCYFVSEEFLPETPFVLALIEFEEVDTLLLTRLLGVDPDATNTAVISDWLPYLSIYEPMVVPSDIPQKVHVVVGMKESLNITRKHVMSESTSTPEEAELQIMMASEIVGGLEELRKRHIMSAMVCHDVPPNPRRTRH